MDIIKNTVAAEQVSQVALEAPQEEAFDIGSVNLVKDANEGASVKLHHPINGRDVNIIVYVIGRDSDKFKEIQAAQAQARVQKAARNMRPSMVDPREQEREGIELLAACTLGWDRMKLNGREVPFSIANAEIIYAAHPWIKEQVDLAIADRAVFTKA